MTTSTTPVLVLEELTGGLLHAVDAGQDGLLERRRERDRHVRRGDPPHRPVEVLERGAPPRPVRDDGGGGAGPGAGGGEGRRVGAAGPPPLPPPVQVLVLEE